jgi:uncharacterized membrane protein
MSDGQEPAGDYRISKNRLEALVDGIFAFAMTLLVTGLVIPQVVLSEAADVLPARIAAMRPELFSFLIAFFVLAAFWLAHHRQFHAVKTVDPGLVRITLLVLACIVLVPFTTNISGDYSDVQIAVDLFHGNMFLIGLLLLLHWNYLIRHPDLTADGVSRRNAVNGTRRCLVLPFVSAAGFAISFVSPSLSMAVYLLIVPAFAILERYLTV